MCVDSVNKEKEDGLLRTIELSKLSNMENITLSSVFSMKQLWDDGAVFCMKNDRPQSAFLWFCGTNGSFLLENGDFKEIPMGALVYIPQGKRYKINFSKTVSEPSTILVEFCLSDVNGYFVLFDDIEIVDYQLNDKNTVDILCELCSQFAVPEKPWLDIMGSTYKLLHALASKLNNRELQHSALKVIEKGIHYLQFDEKQLLSIEEIAEMCFVTPAYFRRLFKQYAGMSPSVYRVRQKIIQAQWYLGRSNLTISEIAEMLGFDNSSYFCRVFKKHVGVTPLEYRKKFL